ncbi:LPS translocon maturation chaperone LptM [Alteromonas sediminis]
MKRKITSIIFLLGLVASCGYRGALYMPEKPPTTPSQDQETPQQSEEDN